ncbi:uncharacterized protein F4812DRAFT_302106 [Daldinia caldariorum]|uniref:uncharacterized protein n=1 Tax=Daldinia caldariorum TaxID=326644 RepID=UPI0020081DFB|nr:uncharacterized protein F4812DRAFT_302106 [Daldinia caldariorum]KAI1469757.1 hypothetical protein F4812DRAFT_302106 [Daldinia caldariorum]
MSVEQSYPSSGMDDGRMSVASRISKEAREQSRNSFASYSTCEEDLADVFTDMDDACIIEEATVLDAREVTIAPPKLPEKSILRTTRLLNTLQRISTEPIADPHDAYLSSEEDASSSADDFSDYEYESNSDRSEKFPRRRKSQEDTARAVSVIYVGKPLVVDLTCCRRSVSPMRRPRTRSSSPSIRTTSFESPPSHPLRKTSFTSSMEMPRENPSFLSQDPFANSNYKLEPALKDPVSTDSSPRAKTPFHRLQRSMNLVRKRSRPNLKEAASRDSILSLRSISSSTTDLQLALNTLRTAGEDQHASKPEPLSARTTWHQTPVTYNDIMMSARRESQPRLLTKLPPSSLPPSPSPTFKRGILSGLHMNRRRSLRLSKP